MKEEDRKRYMEEAIELAYELVEHYHNKHRFNENPEIIKKGVKFASYKAMLLDGDKNEY